MTFAGFCRRQEYRQQEATSRRLVHTRVGRVGNAKNEMHLAARLEPGWREMQL